MGEQENPRGRDSSSTMRVTDLVVITVVYTVKVVVVVLGDAGDQ